MWDLIPRELRSPFNILKNLTSASKIHKISWSAQNPHEINLKFAHKIQLGVCCPPRSKENPRSACSGYSDSSVPLHAHCLIFCCLSFVWSDLGDSLWIDLICQQSDWIYARPLAVNLSSDRILCTGLNFRLDQINWIIRIRLGLCLSLQL